jgi:uncharacterized membrane protein YfcA
MQGMPHLSPGTWALLYIAAFFIGVSKTGLPGIGIIGVSLAALLLPPLTSGGIVLVLLIGADVLAVSSYPRQADWRYLRKLFPSAAVGVAIGTIVMKQLLTLHSGEKLLQQLIGGILVALVVFQLVTRRRGSHEPKENTPGIPAVLSAGTGILAGFTTMAANASGPIMVLYFLAMRLPKVAFVGTAAWFFFAVNLFKVPFNIYLGSLSWHSFQFALMIYPGALIGGLAGRQVLHRLNQKSFEWLTLAFTLLAGIKLCWP